MSRDDDPFTATTWGAARSICGGRGSDADVKSTARFRCTAEQFLVDLRLR